ncbi:MAG: VCBS repeat-containing protein [Candidatus Hydrogenedentes bacterium]|nr:VCBS repeat-containing protein [Candidatus Hydrogenedentota bacterium]
MNKHTRYGQICGFAARGIVAIAALFAASSAYAVEIPFGAASDIEPSFSSANSAVLADIDGDGDLDAVGTGLSGSIKWWENTNGDGSTWVSHTIATSFSNASSVFVADVNGDGYPDVIATSLNGASHRVVWFQNDGTPRDNLGGDGNSWTLHDVDATVSLPNVVVAGDINGDGRVDIAGTAFLANTIYWWESTSGDGSTWTRHTVDNTFGNPFALHLADVNGDGQLDIVGAGDTANEIAWWQNVNHGASWTKHSIKTGFTSAEGVFAADIDGDGHLDVLGASKGTNTISWFENTNASGDGLAWTEHTIDTSFTGAASIRAVDLNRDGTMDIVATARTANTVAWWENTTGDGSSLTKHVISSSFNDAYTSYVGDVDGDGDPDVTAVGFAAGGNRVSWFRNNTIHGAATHPTAHTVDASFTGARAAVLADVNRDGFQDIVGVAAEGNAVAWWQNDGTPSDDLGGDGNSWTKRIVGAASGAASAAVSDVDSDGDPDIVAAASSGNSVLWFENTAGTGATWTSHTISSSAAGASSVFIADIDRDGDADVVCAASGSGAVLWFENTAGNGSAWTAHTVNGSFGGASSVVAADVNQDGSIDIIAAGATANKIAWWQNDGSPRDNAGGGDGNSWTTRTVDAAFSGANAVRAADIDHDGELDIVGSASTANQLAWWRNADGIGATWTKNVIDASSLGACAVFVIDMDNDGDLDVTGTAETGNEVSWYENLTGAGTSWTRHSVAASFTGPTGVFAGDIDLNGKVDILGVAHGAHTITWWQNQGGQFRLTTANVSDGSIPEGSAESVLKILATHDGRSGDSDLELATLALLFESAPGTPLSSVEANALIDKLYVYRDNGDGVFNGVSDTLVTTASPLSLTGGVETVSFAHLDANVQVAQGTPRVYFVVTKLTTSASLQTPNHFIVTHTSESGSAAQDRSASIPIELQYAADVASSDTIATDATAPQVASATATSSTSVRVVFNEGMLNNAALTAAGNYVFNNGLSASSVTRVNATTVDVTTGEMKQDQSYTVTVSTAGPADLAGNLMSVSANTGVFTGIGVRPQVAFASATDSTKVNVVFSESMLNNAALTVAGNYTFTGGLTATSVSVVNSTTVEVTVNEMTNGVSYTVTVSTSGPADLAGNTVSTSANSAAFTGAGRAPNVASAAAQNSTTVRITFDEAMLNSPALTTPANYNFTGGLTVTSVTRADATNIDVTVSEMLQGQTYTATVSTSGPTDLASNTVSPINNTAVFSGMGQKPQVISATVTSSTHVRVAFNEAMANNAALSTASNYTFDNGLSASSVSVVNSTTVDVLTNSMSAGTVYTVTVATSGITDAVGNTVDSTARTASFVGFGGSLPQVSSATAANSTTVRVVYSVAMRNDITNNAVADPASYTFNNGLTASSVSAVNTTTYDVTTTQEMKQGQSYIVTVSTSGPVDLSDNFVAVGGNTATFSGIGVAPQVASASAQDPTTVRVEFSEPMTNDLALVTLGNYAIGGGSVSVLGATRIDDTSLDLTTSEMLQGASYTVTVSAAGPTDLAGNTISGSSNSAAFTGIGQKPQVFSASVLSDTLVRVTFNEAMKNDAALINAANYTFTGGSDGVTLAASAVARVDSTNVNVTVSGMLDGAAYTALVSAAPADLMGNPVDTAANSAAFTGARDGDGNTIYVDGAAAGPGDGSAGNPFVTLTAGIAATAAGRNDTIFVKPGTYTEHVTLKRNTALIGESGAFRTIISGGGLNQIVLTSATKCIVRGFTIGSAGTSSAVSVPASTQLDITNCVLRGNGIGLTANAGSQVTFTNNTVYFNLTGVSGLAGATFPELKNCIFSSNTAAVFADAGALTDGSYNDFDNNATDLSGPPSDPTNLSVDPLFVDASVDNFHLRDISPCRNAGDPSSAYNDLNGTRNDLGADGGPFGTHDTLAPSAVATATTPVSGSAPLLVGFDANGSSDEWGIASYSWDVDDINGIQLDLSGATPTYTYTTDGVYVATLTVVDNNGNSASTTVAITVGTGLPTASATVVPLAGPSPMTLHLSGDGSDPNGGPVTFAWDYNGDGITDNSTQSPLYPLAAGVPLGSRTFKLTVTTNTSKSRTANAYFTVTEEAIDHAELVQPDSGAVVQVTEGGAATNGVIVTIPAGAMSSPAVIAVGPALNLPTPKPRTFGIIIHLGPKGLVFSQPVTVTIPHPTATAHPDTLAVLYYNTDTNKWERTGITNVTHTAGSPNDFVTFDTTHFTIFAVSDMLTLGDVNYDGVVNAVDIQLVINGALSIDISPYNGDIDGDGQVNAVDVQLAINAALGLKKRH